MSDPIEPVTTSGDTSGSTSDPTDTSRLADPTGKRRVPKTRQMLPGVAGICMFLIFMTMINVYAGLHGAYGPGPAKYSILTLCTLLAVGIAGLLQMKKWGWSLVIAGCLLLAAGDFFFFTKAHQGFFLIRGLFGLIFFLYLSRQEVRDRLR